MGDARRRTGGTLALDPPCTRHVQTCISRAQDMHPVSIPCAPLVHAVRVPLAKLGRVVVPGIGIKRAVHKGQPAARGKRTVAVVSPFGWEAISIVPPWAWVIHRAMLNPKPHPSTAWLWLASARKNGSNMRGRIAGGMPRPVSAIATSAVGRAPQAQAYRSFGRCI